jgi:hypothetical protein
MPHPLDWARFKVIRAQEHLDSLTAEIGMYLNNDMHEVIAHEQSEPGQHVWTIRVKVPPPLRLSALIGDCVTNARAALDYIVWSLAERYFPPLCDLSRSQHRRFAAFPIFQDPNDNRYQDCLDGLSKCGVPADAIDAIKAAQPHNTGYLPMEFLRRLVNADKHRSPLRVESHLGNVIIDFAGPTSYKAQYGGSAILGTGSHTRFRQHLSATGATFHAEQMYVNTQAGVYVALADRFMPREPVDVTLDEIIKTVADVIPRFDRFL